MDISHRLEQLAPASFSRDSCPSADQLAAYSLHTLTGNEQLRVAAHIRTCPVCEYELFRLASLARPERRLIAKLPPDALLASHRSDGSQRHTRYYEAADVRVELTIAPPEDGLLRLTGQVLRDGVGIGDCPVHLRSGKRRPYQTRSDEQGFFTLTDIEPRHYTLTVDVDTVQVQIRQLDLESHG